MIMITQVVSGRNMWMRSESLTKPHGDMGYVSMVVALRAWQSRGLTSLPRGPSELRL